MNRNLKALQNSIKQLLTEQIKSNSWADIEINHVTMDTRELNPGALFVAIKGCRVDGYDFIPEAVERGAVAILSTRRHPDVSVPQLICDDVLKALALMARDYRRTLSAPVIAITGSNGKTSVKEMLSSILSQKGPTFATPGNKNNHLGVPLSIFQIQPWHEYVVLELGANYQGDLTHTVGIAEPDVALINNIGPAHIEGFGGTLASVATGKGEIYAGLKPGQIAIVNADDAFAHFWDDILKDKRCIYFSAHNQAADVFAQHVVLNVGEASQFQLMTADDQVDIELHVPGQHHIQNALAASACAMAVGANLAEIQAGLKSFSGVSGRLTPKRTRQGALILDDTYNANLSSVLAAIEVLQSYPGKRILVFGDMKELGERAHAHHQAVGEAAQKAGIDLLYTCGDASRAAHAVFGEGARHHKDQIALASDLINQLDQQTTVLVKGSRSSQMEKVVHQLLL